MPPKITTRYDIIFYVVGDIIWKPVRNITTADIEKILKPNTFRFLILTQMLSKALKHKEKAVILGANQ